MFCVTKKQKNKYFALYYTVLLNNLKWVWIFNWRNILATKTQTFYINLKFLSQNYYKFLSRVCRMLIFHCYYQYRLFTLKQESTLVLQPCPASHSVTLWIMFDFLFFYFFSPMHLCNGVCQLVGDICKETLSPLIQNGGQEDKYSPAVYFIIFYTNKHYCKTD